MNSNNDQKGLLAVHQPDRVTQHNWWNFLPSYFSMNPDEAHLGSENHSRWRPHEAYRENGKSVQTSNQNQRVAIMKNLEYQPSFDLFYTFWFTI